MDTIPFDDAFRVRVRRNLLVWVGVSRSPVSSKSLPGDRGAGKQIRSFARDRVGDRDTVVGLRNHKGIAVAKNRT